MSGRSRTAKEVDSDPRSETERDRDRIIYAASFRRLSGVTQIITPPGYAPTLHTRLTHSLKVAQIARSIANVLLQNRDYVEIIQTLGGLDTAACEAAALAHDIGHPPFGHIGEQVLDREAPGVLHLRDGFEGNAQSIRVVTRNFQRSTNSEGLDLTLRTISAISKYPWSRGEPCGKDREERLADCHVLPCRRVGACTRARTWHKFNFYDDQQDILTRIQETSFVGKEIQSLEASVMDLADDVAYAVHDLEDFFLSGYISKDRVINDLESASPANKTPFSDLALELGSKYPYYDETIFYTQILDVTGKLSDFFDQVRDPMTPALNAGRLGNLTSEWIGAFLAPESLIVSPSPLWDFGPHISLIKSHWHTVQILKFITKNYIIQQSDIALLQVGQKRVMEELIHMLLNWSEEDRDRLPPRLHEQIVIAGPASGEEERSDTEILNGLNRLQRRCLIDYLCGLTDSQAIALHARLSGRHIHSGGVAEVF